MALADSVLEAYETLIGIELDTQALAPGVATPYEFHIKDRVSGMFRAEVTFACEVGEVTAQDLIGQDTLLRVTLPGETERLLNGIVTEADEWDEGGLRRSKRVRVVLRPKLWKLALGRQSRIFQNQSVPEIVGSVLREGDVKHQLGLSGHHPKREYCVQYMESDFAFVSRLLEEEGISYVFRHTQDSHVMVLSDANGAFENIDSDPVVSFREAGGMVSAGDAVFELTDQGRVKAGSVSLCDFDPLRPALNLGVEASADADADLEIYDHDGRYQDPSEGQQLARIKLERLRWQTHVVRGAAHCARFEAGRKFTLTDHPDSTMDRPYLLLSVSHHGTRGDLIEAPAPGEKRPPDYTNEFEAVPSEVPFRPLRSAPWPVVLGAQTAFVTGPAGEEIYTDQHGRVKVQFHWDREGKRDDATTCWVRVNQGWAGTGFGGFYLPRIGQEVIVEFEHGNPDRPMVTGRVYNGAATTPIELPGHKTKSTLRSASSPGGSGSNELRLEDAAGAEQVYLHAQKDLAMMVLNNKDQVVKGNETLKVTKDRSREIGGDQELLVKGNDDSKIQLDQSLAVLQNRVTTVGGNHTESVTGSQSITIGAAHALTVALASAETIGAAKVMQVGAEMSITVGGALVQTVGAGLDESVEGSKSENVGGDKTESVHGDHTVDVQGDWSETIGKTRSVKVTGDAMLGSGGNASYAVAKTLTLDAKEIHFAAKEELQIKVGSASLIMKKNGDVIIKGGKVELTASGDLILKGSKIGQN